MVEDKIRCFICRGDKISRYCVNPDYIKQCMQCGTVFTYPRPDEKKLPGKYNEEYFRPWIERQFESRIKLWKRRVKQVKRFKSEGTLLDVGCGDGHFLKVARDLGFSTYGIEISPFAVKYAKKQYGLDVHLCSPENASFQEKYFDIITFWHTLEHLPNPINALKKIYNLLKDDGVLLVAVPNLRNSFGKLAYRILGYGVPLLYLPGAKGPHLFHFSKDTLIKTLEIANFIPIYTGVDLAQVNIRWKIIEYLSYFASKLTGKSFYECILVVARKQ